jgi:RNA polymerase sigma-54 factor
MKQTLQLKLSQHLTLTPQLQQSIRLLQLSTMELNQELEKFLADNPLLEREEPAADTTVLRMNGEPATVQATTEETRTEPAQTEAAPSELDWLAEAAPSSGSRDDG